MGKVEVVLWSDVFEEVRHLVEIDSMVLIRGNLTFNAELAMFKLNAQKVINLQEARERLTRSVHVRLKTLGLLEPDVAKLHDVCNEYEGKCQLVLHLEHFAGGGQYDSRYREYLLQSRRTDCCFHRTCPRHGVPFSHPGFRIVGPDLKGDIDA